MTRSATDVMQDIVFAAVIDSIVALKASSQGLPNNLLRDLNAIHANTTLADLPKELQGAISASVRGAFTRLLKEGYSVAPAQPATRGPGPPRGPAGPSGGQPGRPPRGRGPRPGGPGGDGPKPPQGHRRGGRPTAPPKGPRGPR